MPSIDHVEIIKENIYKDKEIACVLLMHDDEIKNSFNCGFIFKNKKSCIDSVSSLVMQMCYENNVAPEKFNKYVDVAVDLIKNDYEKKSND